MRAHNILDITQTSAVMVRVHGPDPKGRKMRRHAFYHTESGDTTLSASGLLLPDHFLTSRHTDAYNMDKNMIVITCASLIEPFLSSHDRSISKENPFLIYGAKIDVLAETSEDNHVKLPRQESSWLPATLLYLVDVPAAAAALQSLLEAHGGTSEQGSWEVGWSLAPVDSGPKMRGDLSQTQSQAERKYPSKEMKENEDLASSHFLSFKDSSHSNSADIAIATTKIAVLGIPCPANLKIVSDIALSKPRKRGDFLLVTGSPFGALSPLHFYNSISIYSCHLNMLSVMQIAASITVGIVSNSWPPGSSEPSLLMADIRCLPGMEGSPVFNDQASLVGILIQPLRQRGGGAEVQLVITWEALIATLAKMQLVNEHMPERSDKFGRLGSSLFEIAPETSCLGGELEDSFVDLPPSSCTIDHAMASIVLVTVGDGAWASGIILNDKGVILTNAHLLEPWRFGKTPSLNKHMENSHNNLTGFTEKTAAQLGVDACNHQTASQVKSPIDFGYKSYRRIRVRLDHMQPRSWCDARVVYVSKGPLDVALLQIESNPGLLCPIVPELEDPCPGSRALVVGHGLFGPRSDLCPSVSAGVVARVVHTVNSEEVGSDYPAMLETTAAVHPGGSGGVVVNAKGRMIGLVTSNARHSGGTVIPHLNFSIPCAALMPIFSFANGDIEDLSVLSSVDKPNELLSKVWALVPPTPQRQTPSVPYLPDSSKDDKVETNEKERKGSRFAKFITEKGAELALKNEIPQKQNGYQRRGMPIKTSTTVDFLQSRL